MSKTLQREYHNKGTKAVNRFIQSFEENVTQKGTFDSTAATEFLSSGLSQNENIPENLQIIIDELDDTGRANLSKALFDSISQYKFKHGEAPSADVIESALAVGYSTTDHAQNKYHHKVLATFDSTATTNASAATGLQPNRAAVSIIHTITTAIPFAHYLPADIGSNEARLAVLTHQAGSEYGSYVVGGLMDGIASGDSYISSSRVHATTNAAGAHTGRLTSVQATPDTCAPIGGNVVAVKLLRGRTNVYVNGEFAATEVSNTGTGASAVSGSVTILGVTYQIGGNVNTDTCVIALTSTPALANTVPVVVEGFIDYERMPALTPSIVSSVEVFPLYAKPWRVSTTQTIDSRTQMSNELGIDPYSEGIRAIQVQFANERHYDVLRKAMRLAVNNTATFNMNWAGQGVYKNRAAIWQDFNSVLGAVSQQMANDTLGFGVSHAYVGQHVASQLLSLPSTLFVQSGVNERAGIYRLGLLFGRYQVYFSPKVLTDTASTSQVLCIGRANDVSRNPFVLGDAVAPMVIPLATNTDLNQGAGFYARNFTDVNKYAPSSKACALITITNMGL